MSNIIDHGSDCDLESIKSGTVILWSSGFNKETKTPMVLPWQVIESNAGLGVDELILRNRLYTELQRCPITSIGVHYFKTLREVFTDILQSQAAHGLLREPPKTHSYTWPCFIRNYSDEPDVWWFRFIMDGESPFPHFEWTEGYPVTIYDRDRETKLGLAEKLLMADIFNMEIAGQRIPDPPNIEEWADERILDRTVYPNVDMTETHSLWREIWESCYCKYLKESVAKALAKSSQTEVYLPEEFYRYLFKELMQLSKG